MKSKAAQVHCSQKKKQEKHKTADGGNQTSNKIMMKIVVGAYY